MENGFQPAIQPLMHTLPSSKIGNFFLTALLMLGLTLVLTGCNMPGRSSSTTPTLNITQAYQTVEARLTAAFTQLPPTPQGTNTPADLSPTASQTTASASTPISTAAPPPTSQPTAGRPCDQAGAGNPIDVAIPDDTVMQPNQSFTKIWRLVNVGTCTWTKDYSVTFFSGEQMGAPANVNLRGDVAPGQTVDITVDMIAPKDSGNYQGNWKLKNPSNVLFGIGPSGGAPFWVRIKVSQGATISPTASTGTPTATASPTPPTVVASGSVRLYPGSRLDLDTLAVNSGEKEDLSYDTNTDGKHLLTPLENAQVVVFGNNQPSPANCQQAALSNTPVIVDALPAGTYLCYRTSQGLPGWSRITSFNIDNYELELSLLTWSQP
jgi:hypothetical protein